MKVQRLEGKIVDINKDDRTIDVDFISIEYPDTKFKSRLHFDDIPAIEIPYIEIGLTIDWLISEDGDLISIRKECADYEKELKEAKSYCKLFQ
jgi:hypothetical protein